jgi:hypothetical protein
MKTEKKIIYFFPIPEFVAIMLFGYIFAKQKLPKIAINHERIHIAQADDCGGWLAFYSLYLWYWAKGMVRYRNNGRAYRAIPFEMEAYGHEWDLWYLEKRAKGAWKKYL